MPDGEGLLATWPPPPSTAGTITSGGRTGCEHGDVVLGVGRGDLSLRHGAVDERDLHARRPVDDVEGREDRASSIDDHPGAEPRVLALRARDLRLDPDEGRQDLLVHGRGGRRLRLRSSIAFLTTPEAIVPTCARSSGGGEESRVDDDPGRDDPGREPRRYGEPSSPADRTTRAGRLLDGGLIPCESRFPARSPSQTHPGRS